MLHNRYQIDISTPKSKYNAFPRSSRSLHSAPIFTALRPRPCVLVLSSLVLVAGLVSGASPGFIIQFQNVTNHSQLTTEAYAEYTGDLPPSLADM